MACTNNSSINVPSDASTQQQVINSNSEFFIGPAGDDSNNGSIAEPWASLQKAFNYLENYRITENGSVTLYVLPSERSPAINGNIAGWTGGVVGSETTINHAQSERIHIEGYSTNTLNLYGINYYDTAYRAIGPSITGGTGGYIMELLVGDAGPVEVGDFVSIRDLSYTGTGSTGTTGATEKETDINYEYINTDGVSGTTAEIGPMSLRKTLMYGVHEVLALDSNTLGKANSILVHVRHHNPTSYGGAAQENFIGGVGGPGNSAGTHLTSGAGGTAYMTPQGLRFLNSDSLFQNGLSVTQVSGNEWSAGVTVSRLGKTFPYYSDNGTGSSGGATGNLGITWGGEGDGEGGDDLQHGADGITWDYQSLQIEIQHLPSRINFHSSGGINVSNCKLGSIKNIILCGPGFATGVSGHLLPIDSSTGINVIDGGGINTTQNLCVAGFENGIAVRKESGADISEVVVSSCLNGILVEDSSSAIATSSIVSGCSQGFLIRESSAIDAPSSIATANMSNGVNIEKNSYGNFHRSLSTFNGGHGYAIQESSTGKFHNPNITDYGDFLVNRGNAAEGATQQQDTRHGWSTRTGSFAFRNNGAGWYVVNNSHANVDECRSSYNGQHGFHINHNSNIHGRYSGAYRNGVGATANSGHGYQVGPMGSAWVDYSRSVMNTGEGYFSAKNSYVETDRSASITDGATAYHAWKWSAMNCHSATGSGMAGDNVSYWADIDSKIWIDAQSAGASASGISAAVRLDTTSDG
jgi:hypothetical protein